MNKVGKKITSYLLLLCLICGFNMSFVSAASDNYVKLAGIYETFQTIKIKTNVPKESIKEYKWLVCPTVDGVYAPISGETKAKYVVTADSADKWIKVEITDINDVVCTSEPRKIGPIWGKQTQINGTDDHLSVVHKKTPATDVFTVGGQNFTLLDTTESDSARFLVYCNNIMGTRAFNTGGGQLFTNMSEYLNNEFISKGGNTGAKLPQEIVENICYDNVWKVEQKMWEANTESGVQGGVALLSAFELKKYCDKIGLYEDPGKTFWLRTPLGPQGDGEHVLCTSADEANAGLVFTQNSASEQGIRPIFYLNKDFFSKVKIDTATVGSNVAKAIRENYSKVELLKLYTLTELEELFGFGDNYQITNMSFSDSNGNVLDNLNVANAVAKVTVNNVYESGNFAVLVGIYNSKNQLVSVDMKSVFLDSGESVINVNMSDIPTADGNYAKASLLDGNSKLTPMSKSYNWGK